MENIVDILLKLAASLLGLALGYLAKLAVPYLKTFFADSKRAELIKRLVEAAEQMYHDDDPDGTVRRSYVMDMLTEAGYQLTDAIRAEIEARVLEINLAKKGAKQG